MGIQTIFERTEKKYIITVKQRRQLLEKIREYIKADEYGESTVCSLYFDTDDYRLIRNSIEKPYSTAMDYVNDGIMPNDSQIMREIDWAMHFYNGLKPQMFIAYDRTAFYSKTDFNLRITFDKNVRFRTDNLELSAYATVTQRNMNGGRYCA